jgi:hypothetical protein
MKSLHLSPGQPLQRNYLTRDASIIPAYGDFSAVWVRERFEIYQEETGVSLFMSPRPSLTVGVPHLCRAPSVSAG